MELIKDAFAGRRRWILAALGVAIALGVGALVVGLGGDDDDPSGATVAASEEDGQGEVGSAQGDAAGDGSSNSGDDPGEEGGSSGGGSEGSSGGDSGSGGVGGDGAGDGGNAGGGSKKAGSGGRGSLADAGARGSRKNRSGSRQGSTPAEGGTGGGAAGGGGKAAFLAQADAICKKMREDTRQNLGKYVQGTGLEALSNSAPAVVNQLVIPNLEGEKRDIAALGPPSGADEAVGVLFSWLDKLIAVGKEDPRALILTSEVVQESEEATQKAGFTVCGGI